MLFSFIQGFPVHFQGERDSRTATNLMSALDNPEAVDVKLQKELEAHRLAGPFQSPPLSPFWISPLGLVPMKVQGEFRLIHHLSFLTSFSVNHGNSSDHYYNQCMPMGCFSSCLTFEMFSTAVEWIARNNLRIDCILHILDDYLVVAATEQLYQQQLDLFLSVCSYLGIPIAPEKTCGPSTIMSFADIELDSILLEAHLPCDKIGKCISLISDFIHCKKEVQSLNSLFYFFC